MVETGKNVIIEIEKDNKLKESLKKIKKIPLQTLKSFLKLLTKLIKLGQCGI